MLSYCFEVKFKFDINNLTRCYNGTIAVATFETPRIFKFVNLNYAVCHVIGYLPANILIFLDYDS